MRSYLGGRVRLVSLSPRDLARFAFVAGTLVICIPPSQAALHQTVAADGAYREETGATAREIHSEGDGFAAANVVNQEDPLPAAQGAHQGGAASAAALDVSQKEARAAPSDSRADGRGGTETQTESWTLERCLAEAVATSQRLRAGESRLAAARARLDGARAARWPILGLTGGFRHISEIMAFEIPQPGGLPPRRIEFGDGRTYEVGLGARVSLLTGGELANRARAEEAGMRAATLELAADSLSLVRDVRLAYYWALGAEARGEAAKLAVERIERHLEELGHQIELGAAAEEARIQTLARLRVAEQAYLAASGEIEAARLRLGRLVGRAGDPVAPRGDLERSLHAGTDPGAASVEARPELAALAERTEQRRLLASAARGKMWPSVVAEGMLHHDRPGIDPIANEWMTYSTVGVGLQWTLWDRGARSHRVEETAASARQLSAERLELLSTLESAHETARVYLATARKEEEKAGERVELERRRLELVRGRYQEALATESELLDAQDDLAEAEAALAAATVRLRLAEVELLHLLGR